METQKIEITAKEGVSELVIRTGEAIEVSNPTPLKLQGNIDSVSRFVKKRVNDLDEGLAHIEVSRKCLSVELTFNETNPFTEGKVKGQLLFDEDFKEFEINTGKKRNPKDLADFLRMHRYCFEDSGAAMKIVAELKNIKAKINKQVENAQDNRANTRILFDQAVESNIPASFTLTLPVFKGEQPRKFNVEINLIARDADIDCVLESVEANDVIKVEGNKIIDRELKAIDETAPEIVVIEV
jgi:hypothetical protein